MASWTALFSSLNRALFDVLRAEIEQLNKDLATSGRRLATGIGLLALAFGLLLLLCGVLIFAAIAALALVLPVWGAALVIAGVVALAAALLVLLGIRRLRAVENPAATVRRRVENHLAWWQNRLVSDGRDEVEAEETD
jgi:membrane protein implicated in regulation of membrane protease activity